MSQGRRDTRLYRLEAISCGGLVPVDLSGGNWIACVGPLPSPVAPVRSRAGR